MGKIKNGKLLYHLTDISNLESIIKHGLLSRRALLENNLVFGDVADQEILKKRTSFELDKYIPFHFHPYSAFDVAVKNNHQNIEFVYICIKRDFAKENNFKVLLKHPLSSDDLELFNYKEGFELIDWDAMESSSINSDYNKNVRMAECLTDKVISVECFHEISVRNKAVKRYVEEMFGKYDKQSPFITERIWLNRD